MLAVVRHGRTSWNAEGRAQGWAPVGLDEVGIGQAGAAASALAALIAQPVQVVCSDLRRAMQTASIIATALEADYSCSAELREVDCGRWTGLTDDEIEALDPDLHARWRAGADVRRGGGETYAEAGARVASFIVGLAAATPADVSLVIVGHGKSLQWALEDLVAMELIDLMGPAPHLGNGEILVLDEWRTLDLQPSRSVVSTAIPAGSPAAAN